MRKETGDLARRAGQIGCLSCLVAFAACGQTNVPVQAGPGPPATLSSSIRLAQSDANPAKYYWQAFAALPAFSAPENETLRNGRDPAAAQAIIDRCTDSLAVLRKAAITHGDCDWGLDIQAGPNMAPPHAGPAQQLARVGCLAARCEFQRGDAEGAGRDLVAVLILGRRTGGDLTLNSILIQFAIEYLAAQNFAENLQFAPRASLERLALKLAGVPSRKTLSESVRYDQKYMLGWYEKRIDEIGRGNANDPEKAMGLIAASLETIETGDWRQRLRHASADTPGEVLKLLGQTGMFYEEATALLERPYDQFASTGQEFRHRIGRNPNPFPNAFLAAFVSTRTRAKEFRAETAFAILQAGIACKLRGPGALKDMPDPVTGHPFTLAKTATGFTLSSEVKFDNEFVRLDFVDSGQPFKR